MPFLATASIVARPSAAFGTSMTFGFTLVCTASRMSRPARSMAVAVFQGKSMFALAAAIIARMTRWTSPPASTCDSISAVVTSSPARVAWMRELTMAAAFTFRSRMPINSSKLTRAPLTSARMYSPMNWNSTAKRISRMRRMKTAMPIDIGPQLDGSSGIAILLVCVCWCLIVVRRAKRERMTATQHSPILKLLHRPHRRAVARHRHDLDRAPGRDHAQFRDCFDSPGLEFAHAHRAKLAHGDAALPDAHQRNVDRIDRRRREHDAPADRRLRPDLHRRGAGERQRDRRGDEHDRAESHVDAIARHDRRRDRAPTENAEQPVGRQQQLAEQQCHADAEQEDGELRKRHHVTTRTTMRLPDTSRTTSRSPAFTNPL